MVRNFAGRLQLRSDSACMPVSSDCSAATLYAAIQCTKFLELEDVIMCPRRKLKVCNSTVSKPRVEQV